MISKLQNGFFLVLVILLVAFLIRIYNPSFPFFTSDEARIAYRGYTLVSAGQDELGRSFPLLFNSLQDYQLPSVSYITSLGILLFGKNDFGARLPFILISVLILVLVYKVSEIFNPQKEFRVLSVLVAAFSPALIFSSKIPNEMIVFTLGLILLFYLLTKKKLNLLSIGLAMVFVLATSKAAWWILTPFTIFTLRFFQEDLTKGTKIKITIISLLLVAGTLALFLQVPQASRSLLENNFSLFQNTSIKVLVDRLRGQGLEAGWPQLLEKILFNKAQVVFVGILNWLHNLNPSILFGRFDETGVWGFTGMGLFAKTTLFPFVMGLIYIIRKGNKKLRALIFYFLVLTFPLMFVYPADPGNIFLTVIPFVTFIIVLGLLNLNRFLKYTVVVFMTFEVFVNVIYFSPETKNANDLRPIWIKEVVKDSYNLSVNSQVAISDDLVPDIVSYLEWLSPLAARDDFKDILFPYKFRQTQVGTTRIVGFDDNFYFCGLDKPTYVFASNRDLAEIKKWLNIDTEKTVKGVYKDLLDNERVYRLSPTICIK